MLHIILVSSKGHFYYLFKYDKKKKTERLTIIQFCCENFFLRQHFVEVICIQCTTKENREMAALILITDQFWLKCMMSF